MPHNELETLADKICDGHLRRKVNALLKNPTFKIDNKEHSGLPLETSPAGLSHHHSYPGGYVEHVTSTLSIALALCDSVEKVYHGRVNRDLVTAGVLLHDIFKPATYTMNANGSYSSTSLADYLDHLSLATSELVRRNFPLELVHIVTAHHGNYGPIRPHTIEALICHLADQVDSRLNGDVLSAAAYFTRKTIGQELSGLDSKEAFDIVDSKAKEGWRGVARACERIKQNRKAQKTL